ncbi:MAG TPA: hypothetical protein VM468_05065 [Mycoplana sp.]|nr:hypothetical protein [Mycoplana sp.]
MSKTRGHIVGRMSRSQMAACERSRRFASLLLLGLTRGCRVL